MPRCYEGNNVKQLNCVLIGNNDLLLSCLESLLDLGHEITSVVTENKEINTFCQQNKISLNTSVESCDKQIIFVFEHDYKSFLSFSHNNLIVFCYANKNLYEKINPISWWGCWQDQAFLLAEEPCNSSNIDDIITASQDLFLMVIRQLARVAEDALIENDFAEKIISLTDLENNVSNNLFNDIKSNLATQTSHIIAEINETAADYPSTKTLIDLFQQHVIQSPEKICCTFEKQQLTYQQLNQRANCLSQTIKKQIKNEIAEDAIIAVCMVRSLDMVISLLAILKLGAAYLPLEPNFPQQRLAYIISDAKPLLLLTYLLTPNPKTIPVH